MKKLIALAVAVTVMSPFASMAANDPDNVGSVTLLGNIVANSPMWQWTVNDYPGTGLDAKPSDATTANGVTMYTLAGQPFIAVSGYLPSHVGIRGNSTNWGFFDVAGLTDGDGNPIEIMSSGKTDGSVNIELSAVSTSQTGAAVSGKLILRATDARALHIARGGSPTAGGQRAYNMFLLFNSSGFAVSQGDACFTGNGDMSGVTISGSPNSPQITGLSSALTEGLLTAMASARGAGAVEPEVTDEANWQNNWVEIRKMDCWQPTSSEQTYGTVSSRGFIVKYAASARALELTPIALAFSEPVVGAWNATLNVTAYQM